MTCKIDKLETLEECMGGLVVDVEELSTELIERLKSPNPSISEDSKEWLELTTELSKLAERTNDLLIISSNREPIFRESDNEGIHSLDYLTQFIPALKPSKWEDEDEYIRVPCIFVILDSSIFDKSEVSSNIAEKQMFAWKEYIFKCLDEITLMNPPEIIIHIREKEDSLDPIEVYNKNYHSAKIDSEDINPEIPTIIFDCSPIEIHLEKNYMKENNFSPDFFIMYSLIDSEDNIDMDIKEKIKHISNGYAILHRTNIGMGLISKILEFTCKLAIKNTIHTPGTNLITDFTTQIFATSRSVMISKSGSIIGNRYYNEMGQFSSNNLESFSNSWSEYKAVDFFKELSGYDEMIKKLDYEKKIDLRTVFERRKKLLFDFCYANGLIDKYNQYMLLQFIPRGGNTSNLESKSMEERKTKFIEDICDKLGRKNHLINLKNLLELNEDLEIQPRVAVELFRELRSCMDCDLYHKLCVVNHPLNWKESEHLKSLQQYGVKFNLIHYLAAYESLKTFLSSLKDTIMRIDNSDLICHFFNLEPRRPNDG